MSLNFRKIVQNRRKKTKYKSLSIKDKSHNVSEPGFDPGTSGLWAHHASAAPL